MNYLATSDAAAERMVAADEAGQSSSPAAWILEAGFAA